MLFFNHVFDTFSKWLSLILILASENFLLPAFNIGMFDNKYMY